MKYNIQTNKPIAYDSLDHIIPEGTSRDNNTSEGYIDEVVAYFNNRKIKYMDLGCSGGQLIVDFLKKGHEAVGLEGSDYSIKHKRANWPEYHNKNLFTCDISEPFKVLDEEGNQVKFDCISAWEVLEHIPYDGLKQLMKNIYDHLTPDGIFIGSVSLDANPQWHVSVFPPNIWQNHIFKPLFHMTPYIFKHKVRNDVDHCSFFVILKKVKNEN